MTRYQTIAFWACITTGVLALCAVSWLFGRQAGRNAAIPAAAVRVDTLTIRDTIRIVSPVETVKYKDRTVLVPVTDTVRRTDTLYMPLDIERKTYQSDDYRAVVSGWSPRLEEIAVYPKTQVVTVTGQPSAPSRGSRIGFGVAVGPGVYWDGTAVRAGLGATAGVTLTF